MAGVKNRGEAGVRMGFKTPSCKFKRFTIGYAQDGVAFLKSSAEEILRRT